MIIRELTICNLFTYYGPQTLALPADSESALTVVVAPNNSGKTSIIRALKFAFYGERGMPPNSTLANLINNRHKAETPMGGLAQGWVELKIDYPTATGEIKTVGLRRLVRANRKGESQWRVDPSILGNYLARRAKEFEPDETGVWQNLLNRLVPSALFDAFYFKGEPLDGKVLGDIGKIREALGEFLHEDQWKAAEVAVLSIREQYSALQAEIAKASREFSKKRDELENAREILESQDSAINEKEARLAVITEEEAQAVLKLTKLGNVDQSKIAQEKFNRANTELNRARAELTRVDAALPREIGQSLGLPFLLNAVEPVRNLLAEMERENILPADVSQGFVDRVLQRDRCICGTKHSESTRTEWLEYRKKTLQADVNEGLSKLLNWVKPTGTFSIQERANRTQKNIANLLRDRGRAVVEYNQAERIKDEAEKELEQVPVAEIAKLATTIRELAGEKRSIEKGLDEIRQRRHGYAETVKRLKKELSDIQRESGIDPEVFGKLEKLRSRAHNLHEVLVKCRQRLGQYFRNELERQVKAFYDSVATDGSKAAIDPVSLLPSITVDGHKVANLGGGQSQLLALSYVIALARLRQQMHQEMDGLGVNLGKIDDLSFFMDSPLGNMESHYKTAAVALIPGSARQMVLLLWKEEWEFVQPLLDRQIASIYTVHFHTHPESVAALADEVPIYEIRGQQHRLIHALEAGDNQPYSKLKKIC